MCVCSMCSGSVLLSDLSFLDVYYCYIALYIFFLSLLFLLPVFVSFELHTKNLN